MNSDEANNTIESDASNTLELNLRLDCNGRTTFDPSLWLSTTSIGHGDTSSKKEDLAKASNGDSSGPNKRAKLDRRESPDEDLNARTTEVEEGKEMLSLDYSSKVMMTNISSLDYDSCEALDDLLFDCEITDCGLLPRTFWVPATAEPRCYLEKMASEIFHHHVPKSPSPNFFYDPDTSGAEWWVQLRPSPPGTGRYSMLASDGDNDEDDMAKSGISFHWDKDEDLRIMCGGSMYIHPHISTVTYLTDLGAPTMVLTKRVDPFTGEYVKEHHGNGAKHERKGDGGGDQDEDVTEGFVSWPKRGKHLSFDGRYLHAAPSDLMEDGMFENQCKFESRDDVDEKEKKVFQRRHRRVTFLVNIWLNYKPFNVNPFPETMMNKLSKVDIMGEFSLFGKLDNMDNKRHCNGGECTATDEKITISQGKAVVEALNEKSCSISDDDVLLTTMTWPMGCGDDEKVQVSIPVKLLRNHCQMGSNVALVWKNGVKLIGSGN